MVGLINHTSNSIFGKSHTEGFPKSGHICEGDHLDGLVTKLAQLDVSLTQYQHAMQLQEIRPL